MEQTLILIKPDAVQRGLIGNVMTRLENKGLKVVGMKMMQLGEAVLREHYAHVADRPFFPEMERFMSTSPVVAVAVEGVDAVAVVRTLAGVTNAREADVGTIRGDLAMSMQCNVIHASDSPEAAKAELARFFAADEVLQYEKSEYLHVYATGERK